MSEPLQKAHELIRRTHGKSKFEFRIGNVTVVTDVRRTTQQTDKFILEHPASHRSPRRVVIYGVFIDAKQTEAPRW